MCYCKCIYENYYGECTRPNRRPCMSADYDEGYDEEDVKEEDLEEEECFQV